jgi:4-hydroxy-tetrahydrodipicolinate synthase
VTDAPANITGVLAAALTPQNEDLSPNHSMMASHCRWLLENGCDGLAILGTTGEANSFGLKERIGIIESLIEAGIPAHALMPGTGCCAVTDAVSLTRAAVNAGAGGVLMLPPFYYKNASDAGLYAYFSEVIQQVGDTNLKIYLYHFPQMSATPISYDLIEMLRKDYPDTVVGMKDSSGDLDNMVGAARKFPGFTVLSGADDLLLPVLQGGGAGCITACANVGSKLAAEVYAGFQAGEDVTAVNAILTELRVKVSGFPLSAALKQLMSRHSGDESWLNIRPPLVKLSEAQVQELYAVFDGLDYQMAVAA